MINRFIHREGISLYYSWANIRLLKEDTVQVAEINDSINVSIFVSSNELAPSYQFYRQFTFWVTRKFQTHTVYLISNLVRVQSCYPLFCNKATALFLQLYNPYEENSFEFDSDPWPALIYNPSFSNKRIDKNIDRVLYLASTKLQTDAQ